MSYPFPESLPGTPRNMEIRQDRVSTQRSTPVLHLQKGAKPRKLDPQNEWRFVEIRGDSQILIGCHIHGKYYNENDKNNRRQ